MKSMDDKNINFPTFKERPEKVDIDMDILNDTIEYIRPAVQADGGDIKLSSVDDGVVNIEGIEYIALLFYFKVYLTGRS